MRLGEAELCFINSHLAAGSKNFEERNNDHAEVRAAASPAPAVSDDGALSPT